MTDHEHLHRATPAPDRRDPQDEQSSRQDAAAFETALDILNDAVGCFMDLVHREEAKPEPDLQAIVHWRAGASWCVQERHDLRADDHNEVARIRRQWGAFVLRSQEKLRARQSAA